MKNEIPYIPAGFNSYIREGASQNFALLMHCQNAKQSGAEDASKGKCRDENPYAGRGMIAEAWLDGYDSVNPLDAI